MNVKDYSFYNPSIDSSTAVLYSTALAAQANAYIYTGLAHCFVHNHSWTLACLVISVRADIPAHLSPRPATRHTI